MDRVIASSLIIGLLVVGFFQIVFRLKALNRRTMFLEEFGGYFLRYIESHGEDDEAYSWLIHRSNKMQSQIGGIGRITYKPGNSSYAYRNYNAFPNLVIELRRGIESKDRYTGEIAEILNTILTQYEGALYDEREELASQIKNPITWFRGGVQTVLLTPIFILVGIGIVSARTTSRILSNSFFKLISGIVMLVTLFAGIVQIAIGYDQFSAVIKRILDSF
jgi:hypothetical protein